MAVMIRLIQYNSLLQQNKKILIYYFNLLMFVKVSDSVDNMNNQIILLRRGMYQLSTTCDNKRNEIAYLQSQIQVLEGHMNGLKNRNQQQQEEIQNKSYT